MTVDIGGYYGAIKNPYKNGQVSCFPYYNTAPKINTAKTELAPQKKDKKSNLPKIIASGLSVIGLIVGALFLKKGARKLIKRRKNFHPKTAKKSFLSKIKGFFHKEKTKPDSVKKESFFKRLFRRKPKIESAEPPKLNPDEIFKGKAKVKTTQKDGFFKRLFRRKPIPEAPPKVSLDIIEGRTKLPKAGSVKLKLMDLGCKTCIFLRKYFPF